MNSLEEEKIQYNYINKCRELVMDRENNLGRKLTACVVTFGCQMNFKDSEKLEGILSKIGYELSDDEHSDLVLYNTCTVRENANFKVYGRLGYLSKIKENNPDMIIGLCGCMMQEEQVVEKIKKSYRSVDIIFGTHNIFELSQLLYERLISGHRVVEVWDGTDMIVENLPSVRKFNFKSGVNIMYGCDNFCSYCIVPYVRGRERSREPEDIVDEIKKLVSEGVVEVMLLGQNVNSYGKNLAQKTDFPTLLKMVSEIEGIKRVRFMTSHPKDLSDSLINVIRDSDTICRHFHLPLQSGSNRLLAEMNRHYTKERFIQIANKLRSEVPGISITTDIIVGYPGETEEDFQETLDVVKKVRFDSAFTFIYSKRSGTPAAKMDNQVPEDVVKERFDRLLFQINKISKEETEKLKGTVAEVLVESKNEKLTGYLTGRLSNNSVVHFKGKDEDIGKIINVKLVESRGFYYMGEKV